MALRVLVVDDSAIVRRQVHGALEAAGFDVVEAADGKEALERLGMGPVDLVMCDVNMPHMGGIELLECIREKAMVVAPFVMLTTEAEPDMVARARALGAKGWIVKPFRPELLVAAAKKLTAAAA